jgi:hypothetical protein
MATDGRLDPIDNGHFRVYNAADDVVGAIEKSENGYQPLHAQGDVGPTFGTPEEAMAYMLEQQDLPDS